MSGPLTKQTKTNIPAQAGIHFYSKLKEIGSPLARGCTWGVLLAAFAGMTVAFMANVAHAQNLSLNIGGGAPGSTATQIIQLVALITVLSLAPSILMMLTSFVRIVVSLSLLRTAIGLQQTPPNMV